MHISETKLPHGEILGQNRIVKLQRSKNANLEHINRVIGRSVKWLKSCQKVGIEILRKPSATN